MPPSDHHVRLFRNGRHQAVRIPREWELPGDVAVLRKDCRRLILEPVDRPALLTLLASWQAEAETFDPILDLPPDPIEL